MKMWLTIRTSMISITKWNGGHLIYRFTLNSFRQVIHIRERKSFKTVTIYEDAHICAQPLFDGFDD
jgi:hypothetical protein